MTVKTIQKERNWRSRLVVRSLFALLMLMVFGFIITLVQLWGHVALGAQAAYSAQSYEDRRIAPDATILVIGDSTAFGTGASVPEASAAGVVAKAFPNAQLLNFGVNGANVADIADRMEQLVEEEFTADVVVMHAGGNDVLGFTPRKQLQEDVYRLLIAVDQVTDRSFILHGGDAGAMPTAPIWLRVLYKPKSEEVRELYLEATEQYNTEYIDYLAVSRETFAQSELAKQYISADGLHPSSDGYAFWTAPIIEAIRTRCQAEAFGLMDVVDEERTQCELLLAL